MTVAGLLNTDLGWVILFGVAAGNPSILVGLVTVAIASGATVLSHVNDSGFWLVSRFLEMDEVGTLRSWTVMEMIVGTVAL